MESFCSENFAQTGRKIFKILDVIKQSELSSQKNLKSGSFGDFSNDA